MSLAVIIQARLTSTRLPGKVLKEISGATALQRCLDRCRRIPGMDALIVAVPDTEQDEPVATEALRCGAAVVRGHATDVLNRYAKAARAAQADIVMRVTSDCPLIDPGICGRVLELFERSGADYASNNMPARFPHGLDCEVFKADLLLRADLEAKHPYEREHVTPWLRKNRDLVHACLLGPGRGLESMRWTLDHAEDLEFFRALFRAFGPRAPLASAAELAAFCLRRQDLLNINNRYVDHSRLAATDRAEIETAPQPLQLAA
ncbi:MAG: glycosyltransferase family protein [Caulobacterales bacterium]